VGGGRGEGRGIYKLISASNCECWCTFSLIVRK
jgi:hypothetical protein